MICDVEPDWSTKFTPNLINFGRLWQNLKLDVLILTCYAQGHSRYNPIEHCWSPLSKLLTGVTLPIHITIENPAVLSNFSRILTTFNLIKIDPPFQTIEDEPSPWDNNRLSEEDGRKQKGQVLGHAMATCKKYWHGKTYNSFPIKVVSVPCN